MFAGGFTLDAARRRRARRWTGRGRRARHADAAWSKSRSSSATPQGDRYRLLETVRQYARERPMRPRTKAHATAHAPPGRSTLSSRAARDPKLIGPAAVGMAEAGSTRSARTCLPLTRGRARPDLAGAHGLQSRRRWLRRYWIFRGLLAPAIRSRRECARVRVVGRRLHGSDARRSSTQDSLIVLRPIRRGAAVPGGERLRLPGRRMTTCAYPLLQCSASRCRSREFGVRAPPSAGGLELAETLRHAARSGRRAERACADGTRRRRRLRRPSRCHTRTDDRARTGDIDIVAVSMLTPRDGRDVPQGAHARAGNAASKCCRSSTNPGCVPPHKGCREVAAGLAASGNEWAAVGSLFGARRHRTRRLASRATRPTKRFSRRWSRRPGRKLGTDAFTATSAAGRALSYDAAITELRHWLDPEARPLSNSRPTDRATARHAARTGCPSRSR